MDFMSGVVPIDQALLSHPHHLSLHDSCWLDTLWLMLFNGEPSQHNRFQHFSTFPLPQYNNVIAGELSQPPPPDGSVSSMWFTVIEVNFPYSKFRTSPPWEPVIRSSSQQTYGDLDQTKCIHINSRLNLSVQSMHSSRIQQASTVHINPFLHPILCKSNIGFRNQCNAMEDYGMASLNDSTGRLST